MITTDENPRSTIIESPTDALETIKELFRRGATFYCNPLDKDVDDDVQRHLILVFDEGRNYGDDSSGSPAGTLNETHLGKVLAARTADIKAVALAESEEETTDVK